MSDEELSDEYNDFWANLESEYYDDEIGSKSSHTVYYTQFEFGDHPAIIIGKDVFCITSQSKRKGKSGYLEIPEGEGGLFRTSYLNLNEKYSLNTCSIKCEWDLLSNEMWSLISEELSKRYPQLDLDEHEENDECDYYW